METMKCRVLPNTHIFRYTGKLSGVRHSKVRVLQKEQILIISIKLKAISIYCWVLVSAGAAVAQLSKNDRNSVTNHQPELSGLHRLGSQITGAPGNAVRQKVSNVSGKLYPMVLFFRAAASRAPRAVTDPAAPGRLWLSYPSPAMAGQTSGAAAAAGRASCDSQHHRGSSQPRGNDGNGLGNAS